jgi:glutathione S-transferase
MLTLYGHPKRTAANILKIRVALAEASADYRYAVVDLAKGDQHKPEYLTVNPHGKVPALLDDDFALAESDAILWYVAEKFPKAALLPADTQGRARALQWCAFASTALYTASYDIHLHTSYGDPANHSAWVAERGRKALDRALGVLEKRLAGRQFLATDAFTVADIAIAAVVDMLQTRLQFNTADYPNVAAHQARVSARPSWAKATAETP